MRHVYLDNNATTRVIHSVRDAVNHCFSTAYANASSVHQQGTEADRLLEESRRAMGQLLGISPEWIVFTSGGTEGNNAALKGLALANRNRGNHIVTSAIEHPSVLETVAQLERWGFSVDRVKPDSSGRITAERVTQALREDTLLVSVMHVNNETGAIQPIKEITQAVKARSPRTFVHSDGVQAFSKLRYVWNDLGDLDAYTLSAHKFHGPKGVGALLLRPRTRFEPLLAGGGHEGGIRSGTENVPGIVGMAKAAWEAHQCMDESLATLSRLKQRLGDELSRFEEVVTHSPEQSVANTLMVSVPPVPGEVLVNAFSDEGIAVSTGAACSNRKQVQSHVLEAMGCSAPVVESSVRLSMSRFTEESDIDYVAEVMNRVFPRLRRMAAKQVS